MKNKAAVFIYLDGCRLLEVRYLNTSHKAQNMLFDICIIIYDGK